MKNLITIIILLFSSLFSFGSYAQCSKYFNFLEEENLVNNLGVLTDTESLKKFEAIQSDIKKIYYNNEGKYLVMIYSYSEFDYKQLTEVQAIQLLEEGVLARKNNISRVANSTFTYNLFINQPISFMFEANYDDNKTSYKDLGLVTIANGNCLVSLIISGLQNDLNESEWQEKQKLLKTVKDSIYLKEGYFQFSKEGIFINKKTIFAISYHFFINIILSALISFLILKKFVFKHGKAAKIYCWFIFLTIILSTALLIWLHSMTQINPYGLNGFSNMILIVIVGLIHGAAIMKKDPRLTVFAIFYLAANGMQNIYNGYEFGSSQILISNLISILIAVFVLFISKENINKNNSL